MEYGGVGFVLYVSSRLDMILNVTNSNCLVPYEGPLHTRAKSRDHEIVRAQKKVSSGGALYIMFENHVRS
jgi:hypothetical protein